MGRDRGQSFDSAILAGEAIVLDSSNSAEAKSIGRLRIENRKIAGLTPNDLVKVFSRTDVDFAGGCST
jgi:hypothetical protein